MTRPDTEWQSHPDGSETRWRSGLYLTVNLHNHLDPAWQWTVTDGEPDGQPARASMLTRMGRDVAKRDAEDTADELAEEHEAAVASAIRGLPPVEPDPGWERRAMAAAGYEASEADTVELGGEGG